MKTHARSIHMCIKSMCLCFTTFTLLKTKFRKKTKWTVWAALQSSLFITLRSKWPTRRAARGLNPHSHRSFRSLSCTIRNSSVLFIMENENENPRGVKLHSQAILGKQQTWWKSFVDFYNQRTKQTLTECINQIFFKPCQFQRCCLLARRMTTISKRILYKQWKEEQYFANKSCQLTKSSWR